MTRLTTAEYIESLVAPVKPRRKSTRPEDALHEAIAQYLRAVIGPEGVCSPYGVLWHSTENKPRSMRAAVQNKKRGVIAGDSDVSIYHHQLVFKGEIKTKTGRLTHSQTALHPELLKAGVPVDIWRSIDDVKTSLINWDIPTRESLS